MLIFPTYKGYRTLAIEKPMETLQPSYSADYGNQAFPHLALYLGCRVSVSCTIARVWRPPYVGKNEHFLDASRRRSFYGELAYEWFGSYSLSWFSGIILTSSPYPLKIIKGEDLSWRKLVGFGAWLELTWAWFFDFKLVKKWSQL